MELNNIRLNILIVLYQKNLTDSISYNSLKKEVLLTENINIIIWNNSPNIKISDSSEKIDYYEGKNLGLSKIYNLMIDKYINNDKEYLMISDYDTDYSMYDFDLLFNILKNNNSGIFIPKLYANNQLVSPAKRFLFKGYYLNYVEEGFLESKNIIGMNSGIIFTNMCKKKLNICFDDRLNFYGTDTDFFIRYQNIFDKLYVLPFNAIHDLSENNNNDLVRNNFRKNDSYHALNIIFENLPFSQKILFKLYLFYLKLRNR